MTLEVRTPPIDRAVSAVSRHAEVRSAMLGVQRAAAERGDTVMVGRDIGTVVLPDATLKVYLTARGRRSRGAPGHRDGHGPTATSTTSPRSSAATPRTRAVTWRRCARPRARSSSTPESSTWTRRVEAIARRLEEIGA